MKSQFYVYERCGRHTADTITADNIYKAVEKFAGVGVQCLQSLQYMTCGTSKSNPARFIADDGSAREFTAYRIGDVL